MSNLSDTYRFKQVFGSAYQPQLQGAVERWNQTLKRMLYAHMMQYKTKIWVDVFPQLVQNYNQMTHSTTGFPPSVLHVTQNKTMLSQVHDKIFKRNQK